MKAMHADDGEEASQPNSPTAASGFQRCMCGVDTTGLAALLPALRVGLACQGRRIEHVGGNEMRLLRKVESCSWG